MIISSLGSIGCCEIHTGARRTLQTLKQQYNAARLIWEGKWSLLPLYISSSLRIRVVLDTRRLDHNPDYHRTLLLLDPRLHRQTLPPD